MKMMTFVTGGGSIDRCYITKNYFVLSEKHTHTPPPHYAFVRYFHVLCQIELVLYIY